MSDQKLRRSAMDYWPRLRLTVHDDLAAFEKFAAAPPATRRWLFSTKGERPHFDADFRDGDWLVVASYDGSIRALVPTGNPLRAPIASPTCAEPPDAGCCDAGRSPASALMLAFVVGVMLSRRRR